VKWGVFLPLAFVVNLTIAALVWYVVDLLTR
jgi:hypothetical protein